MQQLIAIPNQMGQVVRAARRAARLSQKQLATRLGLSQNRLSELETDAAAMRLDQLLPLLAALGLELQVQSRGGPAAADKASQPATTPPHPEAREPSAPGANTPPEW